MGNDRPRIKIKPSGIDVLFEIISAIVLLFALGVTIYSWRQLPDIIPTHFNAVGKIDGYGGKGVTIFLIVVMGVMYALLTAIGKFPHIYNYVVEINQENAEIQYKYAVRMMRLLKMEIILLFTYIQFTVVKTAFSGGSNLGNWFLPVFLTVLFGTIGIYIYKSLKAR